ncbi:hypothetical protein CHUAL_012664 [Chamberlinius hualienensis]
MSTNPDHFKQDTAKSNNDEDYFSIPVESVRAVFQQRNSQSLYEELNAAKTNENVDNIEVEDAEDQSKFPESTTNRLTFLEEKESEEEVQTTGVTINTTVTTSSDVTQPSLTVIQNNNRAIEELIRVQDEATRELTKRAEEQRRQSTISNRRETSMSEIPLENTVPRQIQIGKPQRCCCCSRCTIF